MPYNLLMPEGERKSLRPWWLPLWLWRRRWWWIALALLFVLVWWLVPPLLYRHTGTTEEAKLKAITDTRTALLAGLIGVGALLTFWLNSRAYRLTQQGQITERYTKAIEQLGSDKLDVRLGGIYALERIAKDSERDQPTVVEVLSAFVREHSDPAHTDSEPSVAKILSTLLQGDREPAGERQPDVEQRSRKPKPTTDVRAALTVLGRLPSLEDVPRADLSNAHFVSADLRRMNLSGFQLVRAHLRGARLERANLMEANLSEANLMEANLSEANLQGADLQGAVLEEAVLWEAVLEEANLPLVFLAGANLMEANLMEANLEGAHLEGAHLEGANLQAAHLQAAHLQGALGDGETAWPHGFAWAAAGVLMPAEE